MKQSRWIVMLIAGFVLLPDVARAAEPDWEWSPATAHPDTVVGVDWSPDGSRLASVSRNGSEIFVWDARTGRKLQRVGGRGLAMYGWPVFSGNGKRVLGHATNVNRTVVWDAVTGQHVRMLANFRHAVRAGCLNEDGSLALLAGGMGTGLLWDVHSGEILRTVTVPGANALSVALSGDAKRGILGLVNGTAAVLDLVEGKVAHTLQGHTGEVRSVYLSKDGKLAMTGGQDRNVLVWNAQTGEKLHTLTDEALNHTLRVQASADGKVLLANSSLHLFLWDGTTGKLIRRQAFKHFISPACLNPEGTRIALGMDPEGLCLFDARTGEREATPFGTVSPVLSLSWHPKGEALAVGSHSPAPLIWGIGPGAKVRPLGNAGPCQALGWDKEGKRLFVTGAGESVALHDLADPDKPRLFRPEIFSSTGASLAGDGRLAIANNQRSVTLWDTVKNEKLRGIDAGNFQVNHVRWSPDDSHFLAVNRDEVVVWETGKWERVHSLRGKFSLPVAAEWSHDGGRIVAGYTSFSDTFLYVWDAKTGKRLRTIEVLTDALSAVAWNPDSTRFASGSSDGSLLVWDADTAKLLHTLKGHRSKITQLAWSRDGRWLASGSFDGSTRVWDAKTGREVCLLLGFFGGTDWLVLTPDGQYDGTEKAFRQPLYRKAGTDEAIAPDKVLRKQVPGLLSKLLTP